VGERVLAIGHGGGRNGTSTPVTVLATGAGPGGHLAVDLPPKPESVGGPLVNRLGHAVGIVTDNGTPTNGQRALTLAVSADRVKSLLKLVPTGSGNPMLTYEQERTRAAAKQHKELP
jgi:S1-C subfamily serine protease